MWILPKQLHTSGFVPDMEALNLDSNESSQLCAQSLFVRSKPSPLRTWSQKWRRDSWTQHLYGRILNPSRGKAFETEWTSLLEVIPANHSPQQGSEQEKKTQDTCGLGSQTEFGFCDQECASLRTSKDTSRWDSPASSATWKSWVTRCRGEYSLRVKSAHHTSGSGSLSWPTATAFDFNNTPLNRIDGTGRTYKSNLKEAVHQNWPTVTANEDSYRIGGESQQSKCLSAMARRGEMANGQAAQASSSSLGSRQGSSEPSQQNWQTFAHGTHNRGETPHRQVVRALVYGEKAKTQCLTVDQVFAEEIKGTNKRDWRTPSVAEEKNQNTSKQIYLQNQVGAVVKQWATPTSFCFQPPENTEQWTKRAEYQQTEKGVNLHKPIQSQVLHENEKVMGAMPRSSAKLNPRWVETLMGLPVGWVMPSCASPVTIALTSCDSSATESCQPQQNEHSES